MATVTDPARPVKAARKAELTVSLCVAINHQVYGLTPIRPQDPEILRAWRLEKRGGDGAVYDVCEHFADGLRCDCPDFEVRRRGLDAAGCKHVKALVKVGLLDAPAPPKAPEPAPRIPHVPDEFDAARPSDRRAAREWDAMRRAEPAAVPQDCPAPCCPATEPIPCAGCATAALESEPAEDDGLTEEERRDLAELDRANPAGAVEGDSSAWPGWTDNWHWEPSDLAGPLQAEPDPVSVPAATPRAEWPRHTVEDEAWWSRTSRERSPRGYGHLLRPGATMPRLRPDELAAPVVGDPVGHRA